MLLVAEQVDPIRQLGDAAQVHHGDPVADVLDHAHVVGDEHVGQSELALERLQQVQDLGLDRHVQRRDGLVAHDQVGLQDERPRDADPLPLPTAELVRVPTRVVRLQPDHVHHPRDLRPPFVRRSDAVDAQPFADAVADRRTRVQAGVRVLEDDLYPAAVRLQLRALQRRDVPAVEVDRARRRLDQPKQEPPDRRLAAARFADETKRLAALDIEAHAVDRLDHGDRPLQDPAADREMLDEIANLDERCRRARALALGQRRRRAHARAPTTGSSRGMRLPAASW